MSKYINAKINISKGQKWELQSTLQANEPVRICFSHKNSMGDDILAFTKLQMKKMVKAYEHSKGATIKLIRAQLTHNLKLKGSFLGTLAGLEARFLPTTANAVLPTLGIGALTGLASSPTQKAVGNGWYLN